MKLVFAIFVLIAIAESAMQMQGRISEGRLIRTDELLNLVGLSFQPKRWCSGSLISHSWVLTAAHCCEDTTSVTVHIAGRKRAKGGVLRHVPADKFIIHDNYKRILRGFDICLIPVQHVVFTPAAKSVSLPKLSDEPVSYEGEDVLICGWGRVSSNDTQLLELSKCVELKVSAAGVCKENYHVNETLIMCVDSHDKKSACKGDSGGPIVSKKTGEQIGVLSFGSVLGCDKNMPMAVTRITSYLDFIEKHTDISSEE